MFFVGMKMACVGCEGRGYKEEAVPPLLDGDGIMQGRGKQTDSRASSSGHPTPASTNHEQPGGGGVGKVEPQLPCVHHEEEQRGQEGAQGDAGQVPAQAPLGA